MIELKDLSDISKVTTCLEAQQDFSAQSDYGANRTTLMLVVTLVFFANAGDRCAYCMGTAQAGLCASCLTSHTNDEIDR